jgi:hypothetical protein
MGIDPPLQDLLANVLCQRRFNPAPAMPALSPRQSIAWDVRRQMIEQRRIAGGRSRLGRVPHGKLQGDWRSGQRTIRGKDLIRGIQTHVGSAHRLPLIQLRQWGRTAWISTSATGQDGQDAGVKRNSPGTFGSRPQLVDDEAR